MIVRTCRFVAVADAGTIAPMTKAASAAASRRVLRAAARVRG
jgi:hypothetical protein